MHYDVELTDEQEKFLDLYLVVHPLRKEHTRKDYPGLIAINFINSIIQHNYNEIKGKYKDKFRKDWEG